MILSVTATVISTIIITTQILRVARLPGATRQPGKVVEIIIESAAFYSIASLVFIGVYNSPELVNYVELFWAASAVRFHFIHPLLINHFPEYLLPELRSSMDYATSGVRQSSP